MNSTPNKQIVDVLYANAPTSRNFSQNFEFANRSISHEHHVEVENTTETFPSLEIINHFATVEGQGLLKVTEIHLSNRIIKIIDTFSIPPLQISVEEQQKQAPQSLKNAHKKHLLSKRYCGDSCASTKDSDGKLRDTKNVVKNIIRLFQGWLEENWEEKHHILEALNQMTKIGRYNNNLILRIACLPLTRRAFLEFAETKGNDYIVKSKINDKQSHEKALGRYQSLCIEQQEQEQEMAEAKEQSKESFHKQLSVFPDGSEMNR